MCGECLFNTWNEFFHRPYFILSRDNVRLVFIQKSNDLIIPSGFFKLLKNLRVFSFFVIDNEERDEL